AGLDVFEQPDGTSEHDLHLPADEIIKRGPVPPIGNGIKADPRLILNQSPGTMAGGSIAADALLILARVPLRFRSTRGATFRGKGTPERKGVCRLLKKQQRRALALFLKTAGGTIRLIARTCRAHE